MKQYVDVIGRIAFDKKEDFLAYKKEVESFLDKTNTNRFAGSSKDNFKEDILEVWFQLSSCLEDILNLDDAVVVLEEKQMNFNKDKTKLRIYTEDGEFCAIEFSEGYVNKVYENFKDFMNLFGYAKLKKIGIIDHYVFAELIEDYRFGDTALGELRELILEWQKEIEPKTKQKGRMR